MRAEINALNEIKNVSVITLGCAKNLVDSERFSGKLRANGINIIEDTQNADALIINTCGFIKSAKEENIQMILEAAELRKKKKYKKLIVTGCLAERYNEELKTQIKNVDYFLGTNADDKILKILVGDPKLELLGERMQFTPKHFAYLKMSEGCDQKCTFCAIPIMRGKHISEPIEKLVNEAKGLAKAGVKELVLIAQDSTMYGKDLYGKRIIGELLNQLADISEFEWIRMMYAYPRDFPYEILDIIAQRPNICNYLDIPLQHGSSKVLKSMRRGVTREDLDKIVYSIREKIPNVAIRSTFIVGYPNETEEDVDMLIDFIQQSELDRVGVFTYSHEEGTGAYPLGDPIPEAVKDERRGRVMLAQQEISHRKNKAKVGSTLKVLVEYENDDYYLGRTEQDAPDVDNIVYVSKKDTNIELGTFIKAKITDAAEYELYGSAV
ncbi:MAG: 30S ribosomal protein S12 methylthiotransferase RimO [Candidatus Kapabacteria bacterium]|nr:30S ribosomal protein S12 methylthiotransferase RimO [Candidatus Kapabacteria bacterium]